MENKPMPCKCGSAARIRNTNGHVWVECKNKCGVHSGYFSTVIYMAESHAIQDWNRMVQTNGKNRQLHQA